MNKNIITIGLLISASTLADVTGLQAPTVELYSDNLLHKTRTSDIRPQLTQFSSAKIGNKYTEVSLPLNISSEISVRSAMYGDLNDAIILASVAKRIKESKPLPAEFSQIIEDNFWDLI